MSNPESTLTTRHLYAMIASELFGRSPAGSGRSVGLELELLPFARGVDGALGAISFDGERQGLRCWLEAVARSEGWSIRDDEQRGFAVQAHGGWITMEPAGQIEYSGPPLEHAWRALEDLDRVVEILSRSAAGHGIVLRTSGYNTSLPEEEQTLLVTKPRYLAMDRYFSQIGPFGRRMMRSTCALQINLDFGEPSEASERWRLANMIAPSLNAIFANSPAIIDGRRYRSYRYEIWRHTDRTRTGRLFDRPDLDPIADYLRFALDAGVMLTRESTGELTPANGRFTFGEWIAGRPGLRAPAIDDWNLHLSTLFPDVRARGYMEIRSIDAIPAGPRDVAVAMTAALVYTTRLRRDAIERLEGRQRTVVRGEIEHDGCWRSDYETGRELLEMAIPFMESERHRELATEYLETVLNHGLTPGDADKRV